MLFRVALEALGWYFLKNVKMFHKVYKYFIGWSDSVVAKRWNINR